MKRYSIQQAWNIFFKIESLFNKNRKNLSSDICERFENIFSRLSYSLEKKDRDLASNIVHELLALQKHYLPIPFWERALRYATSLGIFIFLFVLSKQLVIEHMIVPSGSMLPTIHEMDIPIIDKTTYGINIPFAPKHFAFDPKKVQRGDIVMFTSENTAMKDQDVKFLNIFPMKKRVVKRVIAKPDDTVYFYGGKVYGIDATGKSLDLEKNPYIAPIEHVPCINFENYRPLQSTSDFASVALTQMNSPIAALYWNLDGNINGRLIGKYKDAPDYYSILGMEYFATSSIIEKDKSYMLKLVHHPSLKMAKLSQDPTSYFIRPGLHYTESFLPLEDSDIIKMQSIMTTALFNVKNNYAFLDNPRFSIALKGAKIPDGKYLFENGIAYSVATINWFKKALPKNHAIYDVRNIIAFYNHGTTFYKRAFSQRYVYFFHNDLFIMGQKFLSHKSKKLSTFIAKEKLRSDTETPFIDDPILFDDKGSVQTAIIQKYGMKVPKKHYLMLGDNQGGSADSRSFGFLHENSIRGRFLFMLPFSIFGLPQPSGLGINIYKIVIYSIIALMALAYYLIRYTKQRTLIERYKLCSKS